MVLIVFGCSDAMRQGRQGAEWTGACGKHGCGRAWIAALRQAGFGTEWLRTGEDCRGQAIRGLVRQAWRGQIM